MKAGQRVRVRGAAGEVAGIVLRTNATTELPNIRQGPRAEVVSGILQEMRIDRIAAIAYTFTHADGREELVSFAALHSADGWCDLQGQALEIVEVTQ